MSDFNFYYPVAVRYGDLDPQGHVNNAKYLTYFEIGRTEMYRSSGGNYRKLEESGSFVVVVKAEIRYRKPARYDDVLTLRTTLLETTMAKSETMAIGLFVLMVRSGLSAIALEDQSLACHRETV